MTRVRVTDIRFAAANAALKSKGLLGWVNLSVDDTFQFDCLALRRTAVGDLVLSFPCRSDAKGLMHPYYRPLSEDVRRTIEECVIDTLRLRGVLT